MYALINTIGEIIVAIYNILDVQLFSDFPVTYIQMIMISFVIVFILRFIFGGTKELNGVENMFSASLYTKMPNHIRKAQLHHKTVNALVSLSNDKNMPIDERDWADVELYHMGYSSDGKRL